MSTIPPTVRYGQRHEIEVERASLIARQLGATEHRVADIDMSFIGGSALTDPGLVVPKGREPAAIGDGIPLLPFTTPRPTPTNSPPLSV